MAKEIVVVTTKPAANSAEYGVRDTGTGAWDVHGVVIPVAIESLSPGDQAKLADARAVMLALATADATAKGLI